MTEPQAGNVASQAGAGFREPVFGAQAAFRAIMDAMARPGTIQPLAPDLVAPSGLHATTAAAVLALCDFETSLACDAGVAPDTVAWLRFQSGVRLASAARDADFSLHTGLDRLPDPTTLHPGTLDNPHLSTTLIVQVDGLTVIGPAFGGPGIDGTIHFAPAPMPDGFTDWLIANRARFPIGNDLIFCAPDSIAALPRSSRVMSVRGVES